MVVTDAIRATEFSNLEEKFTLVPAKDVYAVSQECNWIRISEDGLIRPSERGEIIQAVKEPENRLQLQLEDLIKIYNPPWAKRIIYGRKETLPALPSDAEQCFKESGLFDVWTKGLRRAWDELGRYVQTKRSEGLFKIGRQAEEWTVIFEAQRTEVEPDWVALDTTFAGFDVLSRKSKRSSKPLRIEVKGSERKPGQASFFVTRHEWKTANQLGDYQFHLWFVSENPKLYVVNFKHVAAHISINQGDGEWSAVEVPYKPFHHLERKIDAAGFPLDEEF
jgi:hypothetical protein